MTTVGQARGIEKREGRTEQRMGDRHSGQDKESECARAEVRKSIHLQRCLRARENQRGSE
eukprot:6202527-Pleurochrysis_carterae.AAC.1